MSLLARGLRFVATWSSAGDGIVGRDTYAPEPSALKRDTRVLRERLSRLTALQRDPSSAHDGLARAARVVASIFEEEGLEVEHDRFRVESVETENVLGHRLPRDSTTPPVLVMGHYDSVSGSPGADDNASGAIGVCEVAGRLRGRSTRRPITMLATTFEEYGMQGSARQARRAIASGVRAVIDLEMIAYTAPNQAFPRGVAGRRQGDFIAVVANEPSAFIGRAFVETARRMSIDLPVELIVLKGRGTDLPISRLSDHAPFWDAGIPAVMVTDTAFLRNPNYHSASDTLETIDLDFMSRVCDLVAETAAVLADDP